MNELVLVISIFIFVLGLCIGSFLNVVALRSISGESIVFPASKCPKCGYSLKWYDNIPLLSYLLLKGKCRNCHEHISWQYPIVEFSTGIMFLFSTFFCVKSIPDIETVDISVLLIKLVLLWIASSAAIVMIATDFKEKSIFTVHSFVFIISSLLYSFFKNGINFSIYNHDLIQALIGMVAGVILMEAIVGIFYLILKKRIFGEGDTYIVAGIGALLGWKYLLLTIFLSIVLQALFFIPAFIKRLYDEKSYKLIWSLGILTIGVIALKCYSIWGDVYYDIVLAASALIAILGVYTCIQILKSIKTKKDSDLTYLPFGPALLLTTFIILFFGKFIVHFLKVLLY